LTADKVKVTVVINRRIWEEFKARISPRQDLRDLSGAVEEALKEEMSDLIVMEELSEYLKKEKPPSTVIPVKPHVPTEAGEIVRELRDEQT